MYLLSGSYNCEIWQGFKAMLWSLLSAGFQVMIILILWIIASVVGFMLVVMPSSIYMFCKKLDTIHSIPYWMSLITNVMSLIALLAIMVLSVAVAWSRLGVIGATVVAGCMYVILRIIKK